MPKPIRRLGCGVLLVMWFMILLLPCIMIVLATQGEIVLTHSGIPEDDFRVRLIQTTTERGLAISNSHRVDIQDGNVCTIIDVRFFLWQGKANPAHYCSCYTGSDKTWSSVAEGTEACQLAGESTP